VSSVEEELEQRENASNDDEVDEERIASDTQTFIGAARWGGNVTEAANQLYRDNLKARRRNRTLKGIIETMCDTLGISFHQLEEVEEGSRILAPNDVKKWEAFSELKLEPEKVKEALTERETLLQKQQKQDRKDLYARAAESLGLNKKVFTRLAEQDQLTIEVTEVNGEGDTKIDRALLVKLDAEGKRVSTEPLKEYVDRNWKDFGPSLQSDNSDDEGHTETHESDSTPFVQQPTRVKTPTTKTKANPVPGYLNAAYGSPAASKGKSE